MKLPTDPKERMQYIRCVIGCVVRGGEFAYWLDNKTMPIAAIKEIDELTDVYYALLEEEFGKEYADKYAAPARLHEERPDELSGPNDRCAKCNGLGDCDEMCDGESINAKDT